MLLTALSAAALALCFGAPEPVTIAGYDGHAMEPFIARDGQTLFFNSRNGAGDQTDIFHARRIDDLTFAFEGPLAGANSDKLDGVPSLSRDGAFAFISARTWESEHATLWTGRFVDGRVSALALNSALVPRGFLAFNMDAELSADGAHLYFTDNHWAPIMPRTSELRVAVKARGVWRRAPEFDAWFAALNTSALEYAPATSADETEIYFTRLTSRFLAAPKLEIMAATRAAPDQPFGAPVAVASISGFVEAPSVAPDGALYFHRKEESGLHRLYRAARTCP